MCFINLIFKSVNIEKRIHGTTAGRIPTSQDEQSSALSIYKYSFKCNERTKKTKADTTVNYFHEATCVNDKLEDIKSSAIL